MVNIYDILLNLQDGNRVYEFFEWSNKDEIEHIRKIPLVKISSNSLDSLIKYNIIINKDFLIEIYKRTEIYDHNKINVIDYACLFTDGYKVLAIEFNKEGKSLFKSYLLLDEEDEILQISDEIKTKSIKYKKIKNTIKNNYLTREEEYKKNYLVRELKNAKKNNRIEKIKYLYEEIYPTSSKSVDEKYNILINDNTNNYRECYNELFKILKLSHSKKKTLQIKK